MDRIQPVLIFAGRACVGTVLAALLSMVGLGLAWGSFVLSSSASRSALIASMVAGAGIGAGIGAFIASLKLDGNARAILVPTVVLALLAGVVGAWGAFEFGATREVECCARPSISPFGYNVLGATVVSNGAVLAFGIALGFTRELTAKRRRAGVNVH